MIPHYYQDIQGWFDFQDIYREVVTRAPDDATLVEVGSWKGQSLSFLLVEAANSGKRLNIVGVDHFRGGVGETYHAEELTRVCVESECRCNCDRAGYPYQLHVLSSVEAATFFNDRSLDFVFIDGSHDYPSVREDIAAWMPKVKWSGLLGGHDYLGAWPGVRHAVQDFISPGELSFSGASWLYRKTVPATGNWIRHPEPNTGWLLYIPFVNRPDLLGNAIRSVQQYAERVVVIDQSADGEAFSLHTGPVVRWMAPRRFTTMMNWMQRDASRRDLTKFGFMHSDAEVAPGGIGKLIAEADRLESKEERWGVIFTHYDALALFNKEAVEATGCWDETFLWYVSDVDYYNRLRWLGWEQKQLAKACALHHGSQTLPSLTAAERDAVVLDHNWSINHYRHKWGCLGNEGDRGRLWTVPYNNEPAPE